MSERSTPLFSFARVRSVASIALLAIVTLTGSLSWAAEDVRDAVQAGQQNIKPSDSLPAARSTNQPLPATPSPVAGHQFGVVRQAGIGGPTAYARGGVLELGGGFAWQQAQSAANIALSPFIGWFFADNFELSFIGKYSYGHSPAGTTQDINGNQVSVPSIDSHLANLLIEPSVHIPVVDNLFLFAGWGLGVAVSGGSSSATVAGFSMTPRLGVNLLIGRSGLLTPSIDLSFISNSAVGVINEGGTPSGQLAVNTRYGANISYAVMW